MNGHRSLTSMTAIWERAPSDRIFIKTRASPLYSTSTNGRNVGLASQTGKEFTFGIAFEPAHIPLPKQGTRVLRATSPITRRKIKVRPFGVDFDRRSLRSDCRQGSKPAARRSARTSLRVLDCVLASATGLSSGRWRCPFFDCARFRFYEFSVVLEVMPPQKNRSASLVARNFWFMREGRPFVVSFLSGFSIRSERSAPDE